MYRFTHLMTVCLSVLIAACIADTADPAIDEALTEVEGGKADEVGDYRHYLLWADPSADDRFWMARAGGGALRCPDDVVRETCEVTSLDVVPTSGLRANPDTVFDELHDHAMIARGRLIRTVDDRVYLRASALTRGLTVVTPTASCYRLRAAGTCSSTSEPCYPYNLERLDSTTVEHPQVLFFDNVDPTPDFWGQPTPAVQEQIDRALVLAQSRPVYTCGELDRRDTGDLWWANQVFAPAR